MKHVNVIATSDSIVDIVDISVIGGSGSRKRSELAEDITGESGKPFFKFLARDANIRNIFSYFFNNIARTQDDGLSAG